MKYVGSKNRIARDLLSIMLPYREDRTWVEPFVGGGNMIDKATGDRLGSDANADVIGALMFIRDHLDEIPKNNLEFTENMYKSLRGNESSMLKSFAGFAYSFGAKWLGGWSRSGNRDYVNEAYKNAMKQSPKLQGVVLKCCAYDELDIPKNSIIYCDPPYKNTTKYNVDTFAHDKFFDWCREMKQLGHVVFVSEYQAPDDFECVYAKEIASSLDKNTGGKIGKEKLFKV
jgi:DNA adenine methylase